MKLSIDNHVYTLRIAHHPRDTRIFLLDGEYSVHAVGLAFLHPKDCYNRRVGRKLAFTRLVQYLYPTDKRARGDLWAQFWAQVKHR